MPDPPPTGVLSVVATPIGNLEDITLRALRVLREADLIAAEDTRRTARLLQHYSISTPTTSFHEHNERRKLPALLARLRAGGRVALVTDAGTPGISDPGAILVRAAREAGVRVEAIPGASAITVALAMAGHGGDAFVFTGFPPRRSNARHEWLQAIATEPRTVVFFEAPHRIEQTLRQAADIFGNRPIIVTRELTKMHEELVEGPIQHVLARLGSPRGELTVVVPAPAPGDKEPAAGPGDDRLTAEYGHLTNQLGLSRREAIQTLAKRYGVGTRAVFAAVERGRKICR